MRFSHFICLLFCSAIPEFFFAQSNLDSLYTVFAQAKTDSAKLEASFVIIQQFEDYKLDEQKKWVDTTAEIAARMPTHHLAYLRRLYLANWHRGIGNFEEGYQLSMQAAKKFKEFRDTLNQCIALFEAGTSLAEFNPKAAINVLKEAVGLSRELENEHLAARCLTNLGYAMEMAKLNTTEEYRTTMEAALEVFKKNGDMDGILVTNFNLVEYHVAKGQLERARQCIADIQKAMEGNTNELFLVYPLVCEANVLMAEGRVNKALPNYEAAWEMLGKYGIIDGKLELYPDMIDAYEAAGDFKNAFKFSKEFQMLKDSMVSLEKNKTVQNLQTRYETEKKEARITAQQADLTRSTKEKWMLGAGLVLLAGLAGLFWQQRHKTQVANLELAVSNEEIQLKNQKLDLLMRELHHRVKNNLQLVSSLLRLQSRQINDEGASAAIKAGQLRVEAMSLIHQRLYREEGITLVNMQEFTIDLVEKIAFAFGHSMETFSQEIDFHPADLDVDKAMPISLILNELLTNSFKYAFAQTPHPAIRISLRALGEKLRLHYADNGAGLPAEAARSSAFGSKLITSLSGQLDGEPRQWNEGGANFELVFRA